jgi:hypothetical protein
LSGGGPGSVDIVARGGANYSLYGTAGNDTIEGGSGTSTLDIHQGGHDTVIFSGGVSGGGVVDGLEIAGFHATNIGSGGSDLLDFTALGLKSDGSVPSAIHYGTITADSDFIPASGSAIDVNVWGFTNLAQADTATMDQVASAIRGYTNSHAFNTNDKMIFLIADSVSESGAVHTGVYLWDDAIAKGAGDITRDDGRVNASELTKLGVLNDFYQSNIGSLTDSNFVDHGGIPL